ncbi:MAG: sulfatase-like hydrolase/transferase, partial [Spirochaetota bacterium]
LQARAVYDACCYTPNLDRLRERGLSFTRAFTPNAVCSPARASLMTGKLPHNHNVMWVTHTMAPDQVRIRDGAPERAARRDAAAASHGRG